MLDSIINPINLRFSNSYSSRKKYRADRGRLFQSYDINGISSENEYIPIGAPKMNLGIYNGKVVHYSIPKSNGSAFRGSGGYKGLYENLAYTTMPFYFKTISMETHLTGVKGILFKELKDNKVNILFLVAVKTEYMKQMFNEVSGIYDEPKDMSKFAIFISKEFYTSMEYKTIHNKIQKEIIKPLLEKGVELIITNNIEKRCFNNGVVKPKFRSVTEMKEYLFSFNQAI
jgi:hypothetical protein